MWWKVDDGMATHPKVLAVSVEARWAWVTACCYCARYLTDGRVPKGFVGEHEAELVAGGLLDYRDGGVWVHDWLDFNMPADAHRAKLAARSEAGKRGAASRWMAKPMASAMANGLAKQCPDPDPDPEQIQTPPLTSFEGGPGDTSRPPSTTTEKPPKKIGRAHV